MFRHIRFKRPDNPILRRLAQPDIGPGIAKLFASNILLSLVIITLYALFSKLDRLDSAMIVLQIIGWPTAIILSLILVLMASNTVVRETHSEPYELLRLTEISSASIVWAFWGGIAYRLRTYCFALMWILGLVLLPIFDQAKHINNVPLGIMMFFLSCVYGLAIGLTLISTALVTTLRFRHVSIASALTLTITASLGPVVTAALILAFYASNGGPPIIFAHLSLFLPLSIAYIVARNWQLPKPDLFIDLTSVGAMFMIVAFVFLALISESGLDLQFHFYFWLINAFSGLYFGLRIRQYWLHPQSLHMIAFLTWQVLMTATVLLDIAYPASAMGNYGIWLAFDTFLMLPYAFSLALLSSAKPYVWPRSD